jgi:hypothetical protein
MVNLINSEDIQSVKHSSSFFDQLSKLSETKQITVDEKEIEIDLFVGGDMKFLQILLGLGDSTGDFACPWNHKTNSTLAGILTFLFKWSSVSLKSKIRFIRRISVILSIRGNY